MEQTNEPIIKKERKQMERKALWRWNEDGSYNHKPTSESYFRDYYREKCSIQVECPLCNRSVVKQKLARHQQTKVCVKNTLIKLRDLSDSSSGSENC